MAKCIICKSTSRPVTFHQHPQSQGAGSHWCHKCERKDYQQGDIIVGISWMHPRRGKTWIKWRLGHPLWPDETLEDQLQDILEVGTWAQEQEKDSCGFSDWHHMGNMAGGFQFGHESSMKFLQEHIESFREIVPLIPSLNPEPEQATLDEFMEVSS